MKTYRISLDSLFDDGLWDALNKGSMSGHWIDHLEAATPSDAAKRALERITPKLLEVFEKHAEEAEED